MSKRRGLGALKSSRGLLLEPLFKISWLRETPMLTDTQDILMLTDMQVTLTLLLLNQ